VVWDALVVEFSKPVSSLHAKRYGKTANALLADTTLSPAEVALEIPSRARRYRAKWPGADLTLEAFAKHWPDLRANGTNYALLSPLPELPAGQTF
jgi:hypothetical protein